MISVFGNHTIARKVTLLEFVVKCYGSHFYVIYLSIYEVLLINFLFSDWVLYPRGAVKMHQIPVYLLQLKVYPLPSILAICLNSCLKSCRT